MAAKGAEEETMKSDRRTFLKTTGVVGGALLAGVAARTASTPAAAQAGTSSSGGAPAGSMAKGMTFCTLRREAGYGLGLRTPRGILDVVAAEQAFKEGAPTTITAVLAGQGDIGALQRLADKAGAQHFIAEDKAKFGPCVTDPEKIVCIGLNYRKHAAETGNPVPKQPILFNKYNTALLGHRGVIRVSREAAERFDYEAELVIVIGRLARNVSEKDALSYVFGYCAGNDFTARDLQSRSSQWMIGKTLDGSG